MRFFGKEKQKISNVGKIRKYDGEIVFFSEEKTFSSFQFGSLPNWEGAKYQNMPVVAGRLVFLSLANVKSGLLV